MVLLKKIQLRFITILEEGISSLPIKIASEKYTPIFFLKFQKKVVQLKCWLSVGSYITKCPECLDRKTEISFPCLSLVIEPIVKESWPDSSFTGVLLMQGGKEYWAVYYTSPQSLMIMFAYWFA